MLRYKDLVYLPPEDCIEIVYTLAQGFASLKFGKANAGRCYKRGKYRTGIITRSILHPSAWNAVTLRSKEIKTNGGLNQVVQMVIRESEVYNDWGINTRARFCV